MEGCWVEPAPEQVQRLELRQGLELRLGLVSRLGWDLAPG